jgi:RsiW-degrading membrane proteinase PrsW (M82 family)
LFGAAIGAGFAAFESAGYALQLGLLVSEKAMMDNLVTRGLLSPFGHIAWSAAYGFAYWKFRLRKANAVQTISDPAFLRVFGAAILLHAIWNIDFELPFFAKYLILWLVAWVVLISMVQCGLRDVRSKVQQLSADA